MEPGVAARGDGLFFAKFGTAASPALPELLLILFPSLELGPRWISASGLAADHVTVS